MAEILSSSNPIPKHPYEDLDIIADFTKIVDATGTTLSDIDGSDPNGQALGLEIDTAGLTAASLQINTSAVTVNKKIIAANKGVKCSLTGGTNDVSYTLTFTARTADGQTRVLVGTVKVSIS